MEQASGFVSFLKILGCILAIVGCVLNVLCLLSLRVGRKFGNHNLNSLLIMQTGLDLLVSVCYALYTILFMRISGEFFCRIVNSSFPLWFLIYADVGMFVVLLADRYIAVTYPGVYRSFGIVLILRFGISGVFVHAIFQSIIHLVSVSLTSDDSSACQEVNIRKFGQMKQAVGFVKADAMSKLVGCSLLPVAAIIYCCCQILGALPSIFSNGKNLAGIQCFITHVTRSLIWRAIIQVVAILIHAIPATLGQFLESVVSVSATSVGYQLGLFSLATVAAIAPVITFISRPDCRLYVAKLLHLPQKWCHAEAFEMQTTSFLKNKFQQKQLEGNETNYQQYKQPQLPSTRKHYHPPPANRSNVHSPTDTCQSIDSESHHTRSSTVDRQTMTRRR